LSPLVKICGLKTVEAVQAAKGADYFGFVFFPPSPRNITSENAEKLKAYASGRTVAVTVDAGDDFLSEIFSKFRPDYIQLHGYETPERIKEIRQKFGIPIIKAFNISTPADIEAVSLLEGISDMLLFDAKSPKGLHGGTGLTFDWRMLTEKTFTKPWFLSGGINIANLEEALRISSATMVDISSSLESAPGVKDPVQITEFMKKVKAIKIYSHSK